MQIYHYKCRTCHASHDSTYRGDSLGPCMDPACSGELRRKFIVNLAPVMQEHFNHTTQSNVSSMRQFRDELKRKGDAYTESTGIEVNYQPIEPSELHKTMTGEGLEATNRRRVAEGEKPYVIPGVI